MVTHFRTYQAIRFLTSVSAIPLRNIVGSFKIVTWSLSMKEMDQNAFTVVAFRHHLRGCNHTL